MVIVAQNCWEDGWGEREGHQTETDTGEAAVGVVYSESGFLIWDNQICTSKRANIC